MATDRVELLVLVVVVLVHWGHMTRLFIPVSMVIVRHDRDPVKIVSYLMDVVGSIDDCFAGRDRC